MATRSQWIAGARPRTLPAALAPVLLGSSIAQYSNQFSFGISMCALVVAVALQVGVNYANDYSDGVRGTDDVRVGPVRLVGQGLADPKAVKRAAFFSFFLAACAGIGMTLLSGLWVLIPIGITAIIAAWFYTGGAKPYGYAGFGEVFVFVYFGLVAVCGTSAAQIGQVTALSIIAGCACGLLSTAILLVNNLRDIPSDKVAGKRTLAVRIGERNTRKLYVATVLISILLALPMAQLGPEFAIVGVFAIFTAWQPIRIVLGKTTGRMLIPALVGTGQTLLVFALITSFGILNS